MDTMTQAEPTLTKADRCDACGAAAMVRVTTKDLGTFLLCGSHFDRNKDAIPKIIRVHDERQPLTAQANGGTK